LRAVVRCRRDDMNVERCAGVFLNVIRLQVYCVRAAIFMVRSVAGWLLAFAGMVAAALRFRLGEEILTGQTAARYENRREQQSQQRTECSAQHGYFYSTALVREGAARW